MADGVIEKNFPANCLVPKNETGAFAYLTKYPEYNGDGITIAIFDSGVDPRSAGLQVNTIRLCLTFKLCSLFGFLNVRMLMLCTCVCVCVLEQVVQVWSIVSRSRISC